MPNCSATTSGAWFGSITPPAPTRIVAVAAATCPINTTVDRNASRAVEPLTTGDRSSTDSGTLNEDCLA